MRYAGILIQPVVYIPAHPVLYFAYGYTKVVIGTNIVQTLLMSLVEGGWYSIVVIYSGFTLGI